jgi:hypothetical protein
MDTEQLFLAFAVVPILLTLVYSIYIRQKHNRRIEPDVSTPIHTEPPDNLSPAEVGAIFDHQVGTDEFFATLYDLAKRGYLRMGALFDKDKKIIMDFSLAPGERPLDHQLALHESLVLRALLYEQDQSETTILTNLGGYHALSTIFPLALYAVLQKKGYYQKSYTTSIVLLSGWALGALSFLLAPFLIIPFFFCPLIYVLLVGNRVQATEKVSNIWPQLLGFKKYILTVAVDRAKFHAAVDDNLDVLEREFAYVVAFNRDRSWQEAIAGLSQRLSAANKNKSIDPGVVQQMVYSISLQQKFMKEINAYEKE